MYVKKFEDLSKDDLGIAGGKGANLGELTQAGIPVPPGFVVTSKTYDKFMRDTGIFSKVMDILDQVDINNTKELQEAAEKIISLKLLAENWENFGEIKVKAAPSSKKDNAVSQKKPEVLIKNDSVKIGQIKNKEGKIVSFYKRKTSNDIE